MSAQPREGTVGDTFRSLAKWTGTTSGALPAGLIGAGLGGVAGLAAAPLIRHLYPEAGNMSSTRLGLLGAAAVGVPLAGLGHVLSKAKRQNGYYRPKRAYYSPGGLPPPSMYGSIDRNKIHMDYLQRQAQPGPMRSAAPAHKAPVSSGFLGAVGSYLNPLTRARNAILGFGAQQTADAIGVGRKFNQVTGISVDKAVRSYMPVMGVLGGIMNKNAFARGYLDGMRELGVKYADDGLVSGAFGLADMAKYPLAFGVGAGALAGITGNYLYSALTTPTDADLEILENKALEQEARRQTRGLAKLKESLGKEEKQQRRAMRTGL